MPQHDPPNPPDHPPDNPPAAPDGPADPRPAAAAPKSLGSHALLGTAWAVAAVGIGQGTALLTHYVAGVKLDENDFRIVGLATAIAGIVVALRSAGLRYVLIQRGDDFPDLARPALHLGLGSSLAAAAVLFFLTPMLQRVLDAEGIDLLLWVIALSLPVGVPARVYGAALGIDLRFKAGQLIIAATHLARQATAIVLLMLDAGPVALIAPLLAAGAFEWLVTRIATGPLPKPTRPTTRADYLEILHASKWIVLGIFGTVLVNNLDSIVIDRVEGGIALGIYFFAMRLTLGVYKLFSNGLANVLMPSFAKLNDQPLARQRQAYERTGRTLTLLSGLVCGGFAIASGPIIHHAWAGKWDASIVVVQVLAVSLVTRMLSPLAISLAAARGAWPLRSAMLIADGLGVGLAAYLGAVMGDLVTLTLVISAYRFVAGVAFYLVAGRLVEVSLAASLVRIVLPGSLYAGAAAGSHLLCRPLAEGHAWTAAAAACALFVVAWALTAALFQRDAVTDLKQVAQRLLKR